MFAVLFGASNHNNVVWWKRERDWAETENEEHEKK